MNKFLVVSALLALVSCSSDPASPLNIPSSSSVDELSSSSLLVASSSSVVDELSSSSVVVASSSSVVDELSSSSVVVASSSSVVASSSSVVASSSSVVASSSSVVEELSSSSELAPIYGRMIDARDNKSYVTATIGTQTWMADNLNIGTMVPGKLATDHQSNDAIIEKYCYDDIEDNCTIAGGLYQWAEAMGLHNKCDSTFCNYINTPTYQGICPDGWHLPHADEVNVLVEYLGSSIAGHAMKAINYVNEDWGYWATNKSGYSAFPSGWRSEYGGYYNWGQSHRVWEYDEYEFFEAQLRAYMYFLTDGLNELRSNPMNNKRDGLSIRCVKNK